jgi:hypothetical protein
LVVLALLGGYYYVYEVKIAEKKAKVEEEKKKLFLFSEEDVQEVKLVGENGTIVTKKADAEWNLEEPVKAKADSKAIESIISKLKSAQSDKSVEGDSPKLADYGLEKPFLQVSFKLKDKDAYQNLYLGDLTASELYTYVRKNDESKIYVTSKALRDDLNKKVYDLRDKTIVTFQTEKVKKLELTVDENKMAAESADGNWKVIQPAVEGPAPEFKGDKDKINGILTRLDTSKIKEFIEETPGDLSKYGLDNPGKRLTLWMGDDMAQKTLILGKTDDVKKGIYAKREGSDTVFLVPDDLTKDFPKTALDLRDRTVFAFEKGDVKKVQLKHGNIDLVAEKVAEKEWKITQPEQAKGDDSAIWDVLTELRNLKVKEFVNDSPQDLSPYGLNEPGITVNLWEKDKENPKTFWVGKEEESGAYARTSGASSVYRIEPNIVKVLTKTPADFRDKTLVSFNREEVEKMALKYPDKSFTLEKSGKEWKLIEPEKAKVKDWRLGNLLTDLQLLKFKETVSTDKKSDSEYGFDKPEAEITIWKKGGEEIATLILGKKNDKGLVYARTKSGDAVYMIDPRFLEDLPKQIEDVKA